MASWTVVLKTKRSGPNSSGEYVFEVRATTGEEAEAKAQSLFTLKAKRSHKPSRVKRVNAPVVHQVICWDRIEV